MTLYKEADDVEDCDNIINLASAQWYRDTGSNSDDATQKRINATWVYQNLHQEKFGNWGSSG